MLRETNPAKMPQFDAVVANPPFSYRWEPTEAMGEDMRFKNHGVAPEERGRLRVPAARLALPEGRRRDGDHPAARRAVPRRRGGDASARKLLEDGHIDTVIGLPANLFYSTGIPVCILVLKKCKKPDDVLFINAAEHFEKGKRQNQLTRQSTSSKIIETYQHRKEEPRYARRVEMKEIERERLQPEHLPLRQHGRSGGGDRSDDRARRVGRRSRSSYGRRRSGTISS